MISEDKITEIFYLADDFYKHYSSELKRESAFAERNEQLAADVDGEVCR